MTSENKRPERIWARPDYNECWPKRLEEEDVEYVRADLFEASAAMASRQNALIDTLRGELAKEKAKSAGLVGAAVYLRDDMLVRAECGIDIINGEQYRVVNAGNGAWAGFIDALAAYEVKT